METIHNVLRHHAHRVAFALSCIAGLTLGSCAEEDLGNRNDGDKGTAVTFNVSSAQDDAQAAAAKAMPGMPVTRAAFSEQLGMMNLTPENLTSQKLAVQGAADLCLIETTTAGIDEMPRQAVKDASTRANITTLPNLGHFSSYGYRGNSATSFSPTPDWFYNKDTNPDGTLVDPVYWAWDKNHFGKFYAVYPQVTNAYTKFTVSPATYASTPYVDFEVESDVKNQKDLMTACSGVVHYATQFVAPTTNLKFRHALTAVRFKVGQNLSYSKHITKVEIIGAKSKGRYTLSTDETGAGAAWSNLSDPKTFTLGGDGTVNVSTSAAVNNIIMGNVGDNYVFYMIPQSLSGVQVKIYFNNSPTPAITANLAGTWKAGTTKTYALSQNTSDWNYILTVTPPAAAAYDQTTSGAYTIQSYRKDPVTSTLQPVKWKVVGYQESADGGVTWGPETQTKPAWLTNLTAESGNGGTTAESGTATLTKNAIDHLAAYNKVLQDAAPRGSAGNPHDLSMHDFKGNATAKRNTANSYLISAPGWYKIPLVYGNAITNGNDNPNSYKTSNSGTWILTNFKDHNNQDIDNPWITQSNGGANAPDGAKLVWADQSGLVTNLSVTGSGTDAFVQFEVPAAAIRNGNAVIAVTKGGTVVWSWHLWFDHDDVLETVPCTNYQNHVYKFTKRMLGFAYRKLEASSYTKPRVARLKVEQEMPNGGVKQVAYIDITQTSGNTKEISSTLYQWGRKDAMPGTDDNLSGTFNKNVNDNISISNCIQHPENFYIENSSLYSNPPMGYYYQNLWSMDNITDPTIEDYNDNPVVKTVYDPCPAGFKMPASNAFTGFTKTGNNTHDQADFNVSGAWDYGWNFNNRITAPDATVYFPASGYRDRNNGMLSAVGTFTFYWAAVPTYANSIGNMLVSLWNIEVKSYNPRLYSFPVSPVKDE